MKQRFDGWAKNDVGTPAEEFSVNGSLVFSPIFISRPRYGENTKVSTDTNQWPGSGWDGSGNVNT
jgi:hypothetical protein